MRSDVPVLITGAAGFIGFHLCQRMLKEGYDVVGFDNLNNYYDVALKKSRIEILRKRARFTFVKADLTDSKAVERIFRKYSFKVVINLAAQAGVGHSITHPDVYVKTNIAGFLNILESCRRKRPDHLIFASSSSVYGANRKMPFSTSDNVDHPLALYAASKKSNELMAHAYAHLYKIPSTGLRFFSVYGTFGRPDMALFIFTRAILSGKPINIYNYGMMRRDFTYIDDIVEGIVRLIPHPPKPDNGWNALQPDPDYSFAPYRIYNIGNGAPVPLLDFVEALEDELGRKAIKNFLPIQNGDVPEAWADTKALQSATGFKPGTPVKEGIAKFVAWYLKYYNIN
ncbi:MAG TPA: NAD-dependent epimerase [Cyclobacteriaceae bacterium]|nr:NAD-dependent epimerase [Cyclobacteriaceae bacterium]